MPEVSTHPLKLGGAYGSPYSVKMRAVLRYRRIPFTWVLRDSALDDLPPVPVRLIPVIAFPDADGVYTEAMIDSSPLIDRLETMVTGRSLTPTDPVVAFLDRLVEDYADEWLTKAMFHYRWYYPEAIDKARRLLPLDHDPQQPDRRWEKAQAFIADRQIGRRALVGCTDENRPVVEASYERLLDLLDAIWHVQPFVFGQRPGRADMGLYGQLRQLVQWDPVSARIAVERSARTVNWVDRVDDLSWLPVDDETAGWCGRDDLPEATTALFAEIGRTYVPFMLANAAAIDRGDDMVDVEIDGHPYRQGTFVYQHKCLGWLRDHYAALAATDRADVDRLLAGTGCERLFP